MMLLSIALALSTTLSSATNSFDVDGIKVILRQSDANNVVAANLYLLGGTRQITSTNAGIEPFLLQVSERGTKKYPLAILRRKMSRLGSEITWSHPTTGRHSVFTRQPRCSIRRGQFLPTESWHPLLPPWISHWSRPSSFSEFDSGATIPMLWPSISLTAWLFRDIRMGWL